MVYDRRIDEFSEYKNSCDHPSFLCLYNIDVLRLLYYYFYYFVCGKVEEVQIRSTLR